MSSVRFGYTIVYVPEVSAALDFYSKAFGFEQGFVSPDGSYGELRHRVKRHCRLRPRRWANRISPMAFCGIRWPIRHLEPSWRSRRQMSMPRFGPRSMPAPSFSFLLKPRNGAKPWPGCAIRMAS